MLFLCGIFWHFILIYTSRFTSETYSDISSGILATWGSGHLESFWGLGWDDRQWVTSVFTGFCPETLWDCFFLEGIFFRSFWFFSLGQFSLPFAAFWSQNLWFACYVSMCCILELKSLICFWFLAFGVWLLEFSFWLSALAFGFWRLLLAFGFYVLAGF